MGSYRFGRWRVIIHAMNGESILDPVWLHSLADIAKERGLREISQGMRIALPQAVTERGLLRDVAIVVDSSPRREDRHGYAILFVYDVPVRGDSHPKEVRQVNINTPLFL